MPSPSKYEYYKNRLLDLLQQNDFNKSKVAAILGVSEGAIRRWIIRLKKEDPSALQLPTPEVQVPKYKQKVRMYDHEKIPSDGKSRVLIIGDTHEPFTHPGYLEFCRRTRDTFQCDTIIHIGDEVDNHAISYHEHDPNGLSPGDELVAARNKMKKWYEAFPNVHVCIGNHSAIPFRKLKTAGLPMQFMVTFNEILEAPDTWKWNWSWEVDNVMYIHGTGTSGQTAAIRRAHDNRQSTVVGHIHSHGGVQYMASEKDIIFGMNVGCGIKINSYAMEYGKAFPKRPTLGCGVVLGGKQAIFVPMDLGSKVKWL